MIPAAVDPPSGESVTPMQPRKTCNLRKLIPPPVCSSGSGRCYPRTSTRVPTNGVPELIVVHGISLPPGEFGGPWIDRPVSPAICRRTAHPYFREAAAPGRRVLSPTFPHPPGRTDNPIRTLRCGAPGTQARRNTAVAARLQ